MKIRYAALLLIVILALLPGRITGQTGHSISIMAKAGPDTKIRLAYHVGSQQYVKDSLITDSEGKGRFSAGEILPEGVYMIVLPDNQFFEFLLDDHFFKWNEADIESESESQFFGHLLADRLVQCRKNAFFD